MITLHLWDDICYFNMTEQEEQENYGDCSLSGKTLAVLLRKKVIQNMVKI